MAARSERAGDVAGVGAVPQPPAAGPAVVLGRGGARLLPLRAAPLPLVK